MDDKLIGKLDADEKILWRGKPEPFEALDKTHKTHFIRRIVITAVVVVLLIAGYIISANNTGAGIMPAVIVIILAVGVYAVCSPLLDARKLKKAEYVVTDRQIIVITGDTKCVAYDKLGEGRFAVDEDGHTALLCGKEAVAMKPHKWRSRAVVGPAMDMDTDACVSLVLYALPEVDKVKKILAEYIPDIK